MRFEHTEVSGFEAALRGMRNPFHSWERGDSEGERIGPADLSLAAKLCKAGPEHRKFLRMILVTTDITAPLYWWKEFDTYKVGTAANSGSTMHRLAKEEITAASFERTSLVPADETSQSLEVLRTDVYRLCESLRLAFLRTKDERYWKTLIELLPGSFLQRRTVLLNYEVIRNMVRQRKDHRLREWSEEFLRFAERLPYSKELIFDE